jgi:hypothetical protein
MATTTAVEIVQKLYKILESQQILMANTTQNGARQDPVLAKAQVHYSQNCTPRGLEIRETKDDDIDLRYVYPPGIVGCRQG